MLKRSILLTILMGFMAAGAAADVIITYDPENLGQGQGTKVTVSVQATGADFGIGAVNLTFVPPPELNIDGFQWHSGLGDMPLYFASPTLNSPFSLLMNPRNGVTVPLGPAAIPLFQIVVSVKEGTEPGKYELPSNLVIKEDADLTVVPYTFESDEAGTVSNLTFWVIPEPTTVALLLIGGPLVLRRRR